MIRQDQQQVEKVLTNTTKEKFIGKRLDMKNDKGKKLKVRNIFQ